MAKGYRYHTPQSSIQSMCGQTGLVVTFQMQLQFGSSTVDSASKTLCTWMYSEEKARTIMVKFLVDASLPLAIANNQNFVPYVKEYVQPRYVGVSKNTLRFSTIEYFLNTKK